jgi:hypothetical protein
VIEPLAVAAAKGRGVPDLQHVIVPHPYETLPEGRVRQAAREAFVDVVEKLTVRGRPKSRQGEH